MTVADSYAVVELAIGVVVLLSALKSIYNGYVNKYIVQRLRRADEAHEKVEKVDKRVEEVDGKVDRVLERQQMQTQAIVAVGIAASDPDEDFDYRKYRREVDQESADQFLQDDD